MRAIKVDGEPGLLVDRIAEGAIQRLRIRGPVVLGVSSEINKPRSPSLRGVMNSKRAVIPTKTAEELGVKSETFIQLRRLYTRPAPALSTEMITGSSPAEVGRLLAEKLHQAGLI